MEVQISNLQPKPVQAAKKQPRYKSYWQVMLIVLNLSLSNFYFGYCLVYISTVDFAVVMKVFHVNMPFETARGVLTGCIPIGALFGALLGKKLIHWFSRRNFILFINVLGLVAGSLLFITEVECFIIMRLIQGACIGMYTAIIPIVIAEISPVEISGSTGAFTQIFCSVGTTTAYLFYYILSVCFSPQRQQTIWYYVFGLPLVTLAIQTVTLLWVFPYETPKYFLLHHQKSKAKDLITEIYKPEYVEIILQQKMHDLSETLAKQKKNRVSKPADQTQQDNAFPPRIPSKVSVNSALSGVQTQEPQTHPIPIFASIHLNILRQFVGINAIVAYSGNIVKQAIPDLRAIVPIILMLLTLLGAIFSIVLLAKFGRKGILQCGTFILSVSLLLITVGFFIIDQAFTAGTTLILIGLVVYMFVFGATLGSAIWLYTAQICQPSYIIIATCVTWIFASVVIILFPILKSMLPGQSPRYLFLFFFIWTTLSFVVNQKILIETKGKTEHQIHEQYKNMKLFGSGNVVKAQQMQVKKDQSVKKQVNKLPNISHQQSSNVILHLNQHKEEHHQQNHQEIHHQVSNKVIAT